MQSALRRKWMLLFGAAVGAGLGYLYFTTRVPIFKSVAQVMVIEQQPQLPIEGVRSERQLNLLETQAYVVTSEAVIRRAVENHGLANYPSLGGRDAAFSVVASGLRAVPEREANIMTLSFLGKSPAECKDVLDAVLASYKEFLGDTQESVSQKTVDLISEAKDELLKDLQQLESEYQTFRRQSPLVWQGDVGVNVHAERLAEIEAQKTGLVLERSKLQARIESIKDALATGGGDREALKLMVKQLREDGGAASDDVAATAERLFPLLMEREMLISKGIGADHPEFVSIEKKIEMTRSHTANLVGNRPVARPNDLLDVYLESLGYEIEANVAEETKLAQLFNDEQRAAREVDEFRSRDNNLRQQIARKQALFDGVVKRLDEMSLFDAKGLNTETLQAPKLGGLTTVGLPTNMLVGGLGGLGVFLLLAYLLEASDKSFRHPEDVRDELGVPVIGHVPVISGKSKVVKDDGVAPVICTVHSPKSAPAESYRLVRTSLFFSTRGSDVKVLQVTSPDQGDGKSTLASNLAVTIASSGRRTLLIDADMRRPTAHRLFKVSDKVGLSSAIAGGGDVEFADAVQETSVPNLSVMPCGPRPSNPAELLSSAEFDNVLAWAKDRFDFVIVDTPPVLAVSDPGAVAARVDAVLLTLRLSKRVRGKAAEAREILDRVGANVLGVVINGVDAKGDYGYQAYRYGSGYGYRYGYRYRYGSSYGGNAGYYSEDPARPAPDRSSLAGV